MLSLLQSSFCVNDRLCFLRRLYVVWGNADEMIDSSVILASFLITIVKVYNTIYNNDKMKNLLEHMKLDWNVWSKKPEIEVLKDYAEEGRKLTLFYAIANYISIVLYLSFTLMPIMLDVFIPISNITRTKKYPLPEEFGENSEQYYYYIFMYASFTITINFTIVVSIDSLYVVFVQHICGVFAAIGYADDLENTYTGYFFFLIGLNMIILMFTGMLIVIKIENFDDTIKFANYTLLLVVHLFYNSFPGQKLLDHSLMVSQAAYNYRWYEASITVRKSLLLMILRSSRPCKITAGKYYVLSVENFCTVMQTTMSYFTVFLSMR